MSQMSDQAMMLRREPKKISVVFAGMAGSGKSTIAKNIADEFGLRYLCGGDGLQEMARAMGFNPTGEGWWETEDGMKFLEMRDKDPQFDKRIDQFLIEQVRKGGVSITSWAVPWLIDDGFKIYLKASPEVRIKRIVGRDNISYKEALQAIKKRDRENIKLYKRLYGHDIVNDLEPFDLVVNTNDKNIKQVTEIAASAVREFIGGQGTTVS